ncbi:carboxypeptidase-like regulatory domain-containing protein [Actinosynnema sp. NPDC050436]|uniref:carboxypeptidase-like regulatory domain-containing protein n=1 Tax=Actinosynnema sp. NPDC050436 TaxID=3155659 RepID=UPI0033E9A06E
MEGTNKTTLTGDNDARSLQLPFPLTFYGTTYRYALHEVDGFLTFVNAGYPQPPKQIPSPNRPNAAVYAFWDDFVVDDQAGVWTGADGVAPNRRYIVEWRNVTLKSVPGSRLSAELVFGENGVILLQYRGLDQAAERCATAPVGIENPEGTSAVVWSDHQDRLSDSAAVRLHVPGTAIARGLITDANTGTPFSDAVLSATAGGRTATTRSDYEGRYQLEIPATDARVTVSAPGYATDTLTPAPAPEHGAVTADLAIRSPILEPPPGTLEITVPAGRKTSASAPIRNTGTSAGWFSAAWEVDGGSTPPRPGTTGALRSWDPEASGVEDGYGVAELAGDVWVSVPSKHELVRLTPDGIVRSRTTLPDTENPSDLAVVGDRLCYVTESTPAGGTVIHCVRPLTGEVVPHLTTAPQVVGGPSGLAHNPRADVFHLPSARTATSGSTWRRATTSVAAAGSRRSTRPTAGTGAPLPRPRSRVRSTRPASRPTRRATSGCTPTRRSCARPRGRARRTSACSRRGSRCTRTCRGSPSSRRPPPSRRG